MKVYLAGAYAWKDELKIRAQELENLGVTVTSRWLDEKYAPTIKIADVPEKERVQTAIDDLKDIDRADAIVLFSVEPTVPIVRGGRHVEFGYAIGIGKTLYVIGPKENIFHYMPEVTNFVHWDDFIQYLVTGPLAEPEREYFPF